MNTQTGQSMKKQGNILLHRISYCSATLIRNFILSTENSIQTPSTGTQSIFSQRANGMRVWEVRKGMKTLYYMTKSGKKNTSEENGESQMPKSIVSFPKVFSMLRQN